MTNLEIRTNGGDRDETCAKATVVIVVVHENEKVIVVVEEKCYC